MSLRVISAPRAYLPADDTTRRVATRAIAAGVACVVGAFCVVALEVVMVAFIVTAGLCAGAGPEALTARINNKAATTATATSTGTKIVLIPVPKRGITHSSLDNYCVRWLSNDRNP
jgi:ABC-type antimicrobial peptide transport system permease subunit